MAVLGIEGDPHAPGHVQRQPFHRDRMLEFLHQPFCDPHGHRLLGEIGQQDPELVAAKAGHHVAGAKHGGQARTDLGEQHVAEVVAQRVVDLLEVVQVHEHHRDPTLDSRRVLDRFGELLLEQHAIGQARKGVVQGLVFVLRLLDRQFLRGHLQGVGPLEHLPRERQRSHEHEDGPGALPVEGEGDEDAEQRKPHVRQYELTEDPRMHLPDDRLQRLIQLEVNMEGDEHHVHGVARDRSHQDGDGQQVPTRRKRRRLVEQEAFDYHRHAHLGSVEERPRERDRPV